MTLHLIKLCVGIDSMAQLAEWQIGRLAQARAEGRPAELRHRTRQMPRRREKLLAGGSIYWVIKGVIQVRQKLVDLRTVRGDDGIRRCDLMLDPKLVPTRPQPRRAFQGWRYLKAEDAPQDLDLRGDLDAMPAQMKAELIELGLL